MLYRRYLRLRSLTRRDLQREMAEEIELHIALRTEDLVRAGWREERARAVAREQFGDREVLLRTVVQRERRLSRSEWMGNLLRDVKLAWRHARRSYATSALTVATFALGIGLTTAMFTIVDRVLLRPLPFDRPHELVVLQGMDVNGSRIDRVSYDDWSDLHDRNRTLAATAAYMPRAVTVLRHGRGQRFDGVLVTREYFDVFRSSMLAGRGFAESDEIAGAAIVSESLWRGQLGGTQLADATLAVDDRVVPIVGVVSTSDAYPADVDLWVLTRPVRRGGGAMRNNINWTAIGRLASSTSIASAENDLSAIARGIRAADPVSDYMYGVVVSDLRGVLVAEARNSIALLFGAVLLVLLIGCSNVATLTLARAARRRADIATLFALGASRGRVFRQLLTEQLALAAVGGVLGVVIAQLLIRIVTRIATARVPRVAEVGMDLRVLGFAAAAAVVSGVLAGWWPALRASLADPHSLMSRRGVVSGGRRFAGAAMLTTEIALAITMLIGGGLLLRSLRNVLSRDVGYSTDGVAAAQIVLAPARFSDDSTAAPRFWQQLLESLRSDRTVTHAALANWVPTGTGGTTYLEVEGVDGRDGAAYRVVSDDYFDTMRMPILRGRAFSDADHDTGERVAIINRILADRYWPATDPIGARIRTPGMEGYDDVPWLRVVGVTTNVRHGGHESDPTGHVYVLQRQRPEHRAMHVLVRTTDSSTSTAARVIVQSVSSLDPQLAIETRDLQRELVALTGDRRLMSNVLTAFAILALLLAASGIFGLFSYAVAQRTHEFGVRSALGANRSTIVRLVLGDALRIVVTGCILGLCAAFWLTRLLRAQLQDVSNTDLTTYAAAFLVIIATALLAAAAPGVRASRTDPQTALRST